MRLLVLTQKVDREDPVLGFFHNWLEAFSRKFEEVGVICLQKGQFDLPQNVSVFSLGKELKAKRYKIKAIYNFFHLSFFKFLNYDSVFVHMNQEYVLLGGIFWKLTGKKIYLWRNHKKGNIFTRIAVALSDKVFYTSPDSYTARFHNAVQVPVGIDTDLFKEGKMERRKNFVLSLGRISPVKNVHLMLEAARVLKGKGVDFSLNIYGDPVNPEDSDYKKKLIADSKDLIGEGAVDFHPGVPNYETPQIYQKYGIFLNLTPSGSFDKTIFEAAMCGCLPIVSNSVLEDIASNLVVTPEAARVALSIEKLINMDERDRNDLQQKLQKYILENHSLNALMDKIELCIKTKK